MILYCDTSALVKLYIEEPESKLLRERIATASALYTHMIAYAELRAGLAKAQRIGRISDTDIARLVEDVEEDWSTLHVVEMNMSAIRRAGALAQRFALRGYDSVHLAAAEQISTYLPPETQFRFAVFDDSLVEACQALGISVLS